MRGGRELGWRLAAVSSGAKASRALPEQPVTVRKLSSYLNDDLITGG